jgi:4-amino-4-deoxy-L-arabinose transferase-like glycosyltransferase
MGIDEPVILKTAVTMIKTGDFNPHFYDYGGLTFSFHAGVSAFSFLQRAMAGRWRSLDQTWYGDFLVPTRRATALVGTLTILLVFLIARRWGPGTGLLAAGIFAVFPPHVREAHFTLTDTPLTCLTALTLLLSIRAAESPVAGRMVLAGLAVGLTAAVKYNGVVVAVMPALAACVYPGGQRLRALGVAAVASAVGFLAAAPYTVLDLPAFLNGFASLMQSYNRARFTTLDAASIYAGHLRNGFGWPGMVPLVFGYLGLAIAVAGLLRVPWRRPPHTGQVAAVMLAGFPLVYFWFIANQSSLVYGRYLLPIGPMLAIGLALGLSWLADLAGRRSVQLRRAALPLVVTMIVGPMAAAAVAWNVEFARPTTLDLAARFVATRLEPGSVVAVEGTTFQVPPRVRLRAVPRLIDKDAAGYAAENVHYLLATSEISDTYVGQADATAAFRHLVATTEVVQTFSPEGTRRGPVITILKVAR